MVVLRILCRSFRVDPFFFVCLLIVQAADMRYVITTFILLISYVSLHGQIRGRVLDIANRSPLLGVNIYLSPDKGLTTTDENGEYTLSNQFNFSETDTLHFSYIGYEEKKVLWRELKENEFIVLLAEDNQRMGEVTVIGEKPSLKLYLDYDVLAPMPQPLAGIGETLHNGKLFVTGGDASMQRAQSSRTAFGGVSYFIVQSYSNKLYVYDIATDTWDVSKLKLDKRAYHATFYYNKNIYILGGKRLSTNRRKEYLNEKIEIYNIEQDTLLTDRYTNPHEAVNFASFIHGNYLIFMGGSTAERENGAKEYSSKVHTLDLKTGYWYELADMPYGKETKGGLIGNFIYLTGGYRHRPLKEIEVYDIERDKWSKEGELVREVECPAVATHDSTIYIFENSCLQTYNVSTKEAKAYLIDIPYTSSSMFYSNNKLYILGGRSITTVDFQETSAIEKNVYRELYRIDLNEFDKTKSL